MQIVINIDDRVYGLLKYFEKGMGLNDEKDSSDDDVKTVLMRAVVNGIPLPKGHGKLKDEDYFLSILKCEEYKTCPWRLCSDCNREKSIKRQTIIEAPTIIEADGK